MKEWLACAEPEEDLEAWLTTLPPDARANFLAGPYTGDDEPFGCGFDHRDRGDDLPTGAGFAARGALDLLEPGPCLAGAVGRATCDEDGHASPQAYAALGESELIGVLCAWQRLTSWAQSGQAAAAMTLVRRREAQSLQSPKLEHLAKHVDDEIAAALVMTGRSVDRLLEVSAGLARMPMVYAALEAGQIDWAKSSVFADMLVGLDEATAREVADRLIGRATGMTTGQLRAALGRAVLNADPAAADRRKREAAKDTDVQAWTEPSGNAALAGRELATADVIAVDKRLTAQAYWLREHGVAGSLGQLRAKAFIATLDGRPLDSLLPPTADATSPGQPADPDLASTAGAAGGGAAGGAAGPVSRAAGQPGETAAPGGTINLTMPLSSWAGLTETSGEVAAYGPADAQTCRDLAARMGSAARWCLTLTDGTGKAVAHACARTDRPPQGGPAVIAWAAGLRSKLQYLESGSCSHPRRSAGYHPPNVLAHLVTVRQRTCSFPGCRRPAARCDLDHTVAYHNGGITCECNLAPLCRRHHQAKQTAHWRLEQTEPGEMTWHLPHGRSYQTTGDRYPL